MNRRNNPEANGCERLTMAALINQATGADGISSLGSLTCTFSEYSPTKEASEYSESGRKETKQILEPELHLKRLLYYTSEEPIPWNKIKLPEKGNLYLKLYKRVINNINADCKVYIDNEEFECHLLVLQCYSRLFDSCGTKKKIELSSEKCSPSAFCFIYNWMRASEPSYISLNRSNILTILTSAEYLQIKDLIEQCWAFIDSTNVFNEDSAFLLYLEAKERKLPQVQEFMLPRIRKFFLTLVSSSNWLELDVLDMKNLLKSNYVAINCEMEIFMAAVRWLKYDYGEREQYKYEVLKCVRFGNIAPWQLVDIKKNPQNPDFIELCQDSRICNMIDEGISFIIIKHWSGQDNSETDLAHCYGILGLEEPPPRNWMGPEKSYATYRDFLIYLDQYRRSQLLEKNTPRLIDEVDEPLENEFSRKFSRLKIKRNPDLRQN
ncbi:unnamed protein product [Ceutorhynchus assimilis]|uniref:Uncharacterized protein n=1 Tax=Ceutorhynchus assimilis TaxID=467358 RepID=A0A9N9MB80_9CUCU|nr:unnamed protein product [Ceutorhynchus assimilis]